MQCKKINEVSPSGGYGLQFRYPNQHLHFIMYNNLLLLPQTPTYTLWWLNDSSYLIVKGIHNNDSM